MLLSKIETWGTRPMIQSRALILYPTLSANGAERMGHPAFLFWNEVFSQPVRGGR